MKDMISERLVHLASAQESMADIVDKAEQWVKSQLQMEKIAYESLNASDTILNLSKEGNLLVELLQKHYNDVSLDISGEQYPKISLLLDEVKLLFHKINHAAANANEFSHEVEGEVAFQREIGEVMKKNMLNVGESLDCAVACIELLMTEI